MAETWIPMACAAKPAIQVTTTTIEARQKFSSREPGSSRKRILGARMGDDAEINGF